MALNGRMVDQSLTEPAVEPSALSPETAPELLLQTVARHRDRRAFALLFQAFAPRIKAFLMRSGSDAGMAEEVTQEVMVTVWRRAETYDPAQAGAATWIFTIARNKRIDMIRREKRPQVDPEDPALMPDPLEQADDRMEAAQSADRLRRAMATLPEEQREILRMAYFEDKPHSAIAQECGLPLGTVKSRLRLALSRLRKDLKDDA